MRSALLCTIPMLVLAAACADTDPLAPRADTRGLAASLADGSLQVGSLSTCGADAMSAPVGGGTLSATSASFGGGIHSLGTVRIWAWPDVTFQLPMTVGGSYPRYECLIRANIPDVGDLTITVGPDTTTVDEPPRPPGIDDQTWFFFGRRMKAWINEKAGEYAQRCGCGQTQETVFSAMLSTLQVHYQRVLERTPLTVAGRNFTPTQNQVMQGHVLACELTQVFRRFWAIDDGRDRAWLLRGATADVGDRELPFGIGASFGTNWQNGVVAGFRVGAAGRCAEEIATSYYHKLLLIDPATVLESPPPTAPYTPPPVYPTIPWYDQ